MLSVRARVVCKRVCVVGMASKMPDRTSQELFRTLILLISVARQLCGGQRIHVAKQYDRQRSVSLMSFMPEP